MRIRNRYNEFIVYLIVIFVDRPTPHYSMITRTFFNSNIDMRVEYFPVDSPGFNVLEGCWKYRKYDILCTCYPLFDFLKYIISFILLIIKIFIARKLEIFKQ